jgi:hypothetical protein
MQRPSRAAAQDQDVRERLITLGCALAALLLFGTLFLQRSVLGARRTSLPTTVEQADNGLLGAMSWLSGEGVRTLSLRERCGTLRGRRDLAPRGNLLIVSLPAVTAFLPDEAVALDQWIQQGNTLLVLAALRDRPGWASVPLLMRADLQLLTGLGMQPPADLLAAKRGAAAAAGSAAPKTGSADSQRPRGQRMDRLMRLNAQLDEPERTDLFPNRAHPYFAGVVQAVAFSDYPPLANHVTLPGEGFALALAHEGDTADDAFWVRPDGAGTIIVSGFGSLFTNRALGVAGNARLLANIVGASVARDGTVVFDDEHQGLSDAYDPARFYRDPRLYRTVAVIAAVWLTWVLGATRLQAPLQRAPAPREAELVRTTGLFLARVLRPAAAGRRMLEQFLQRTCAAAGRDGADPAGAWQWLADHPRLARRDVARLQAWYAAAAANRRVPLVRLHNLLVRTERRLAE